MDRDQKKPDAALFTAAELLLLNNALNEVCNGVNFGDDEFQTRLGVDRKTALKLLAKVGGLVGDGKKK